MDDVQECIRNSDLIYIYAHKESGDLQAFARVLTDKIFKAIIFDLIVSPESRNRGLGTILMKEIINDPYLRRVKDFELYCTDEIRSFYKKLGFDDNVNGVSLMRKSQ